MKKHLALWLLMLVSPLSLIPCECVQYSVEEEIERCSSIFVGRVQNVIPIRYAQLVYSESGECIQEETMQMVFFKVKDTIKGHRSDTISIIAPYEAPGACGISLMNGNTYIVFANERHNESYDNKSSSKEKTMIDKVNKINRPFPRLATSGCSRTQLNSLVNEEANALFISFLKGIVAAQESAHKQGNGNKKSG